MKILSVAIFGFGRIGKIHFNNLQNNDKFRIIYIIDNINILNKENIPQDGFINCIDYNKCNIIFDSNIDIAFICTPTHTHYKIIKKCLNNNINVFTEKPISLDIYEMKECYDLSKKYNLKLLCGFNRRFDPMIIKLKEDYDNKLINNIQQFLIISRDYPYPNVNYLKISGGLHHDCIIHDIDLICWILNELPYKVFSFGNITTSKNIGNNELDNCTTILYFKSNIICNIITSRISNSYDQRIEIFSNEETYQIKNIDSITPQSFNERYDLSYKNEINFYYDCLVNNVDLNINFMDCYNAHIICNHAIESYKNGKIIIINYI